MFSPIILLIATLTGCLKAVREQSRPRNLLRPKLGVHPWVRSSPILQFSILTNFHSIHMLPLTPVSPYIRSAEFCKQEWDQWFSRGRVDHVDGGWRGVLYANMAIFDPRESWGFFTQPNFNTSFLDGGASRSWYLSFAGSLGGAN